MRRFTSLGFMLILSLSVFSSHAADIPLREPELDLVPGPVMVSDDDLPAPARWPALRHEQPLRLLAILHQNEPAAAYMQIARRMRASIEFRYLGGGAEDIYHVNDRWIEPKENPTHQELADYTHAKAIEAVTFEGDASPFDVIMFSGRTTNLLTDENMQTPIMRFIESGGVAVVCGNLWPNAELPVGSIWPVRPLNNNWHSSGSNPTDQPELAGLPLKYLSSWTWIPRCEAAEGAVALSTGDTGAMYLRRHGKGALLYAPTGPISRTHNAIEVTSRRFDHDDIWLRAWDQALYTIARGEDAVPAYARFAGGADTAPAGEDYLLPVQIVNRAHTGPLAVTVHVTTPRNKVVFTSEHTIDIAPGDAHQLDMAIPVPPFWGAGMYPAYITVADPARQRQYQQAMAFVPVAGVVNMTLKSDKIGYPLDEVATLTLTASARENWSGALVFGIYDFRGRLLAVEERQAQLTNEPQEFEFKWHLEDHGVRVDAYWAQVVAMSERTHEWGRAEAKFYKYERWSMRNEYQWSTWANSACRNVSSVQTSMRMMAHAGMNSLGYPGNRGLHYPAERWGWRYYNEGIGSNTFSPVIEYENEAEIEEALTKQVAHNKNQTDLVSAAYILGSVGEEAGFKSGWGRRYYWDEPVAPEKASRGYQWFLRTRYPSLEKLNAAWKTKYESWDQVQLTREFSGRSPNPDADGWARPTDPPPGINVEAVSQVPYRDTADFYNWYYDRIIDVAERLCREHINPVLLTLSSAPTIGSGHYDVRIAGPSGWNCSQWHSLSDGPEPGYGLIWGHFDWSVKTDNMFWGFLLMRSGHNNYWVDIPLMFNGDMTHTRASFAMRRWTQRLAGHERIILDSRPFKSDVGLLAPNGIRRSRLPGNMEISLKVALSQAGYGLPESVEIDKINDYRIIFAIGRQAVSQEEADALDHYVRAGGTLIIVPPFAAETPLGIGNEITPGCNLAQRWGLRIPEPRLVHEPHNQRTVNFMLDGVAEELQGAQMAAWDVFRERIEHDGWTQLAAYNDGIDAILQRKMGNGQVMFLNAAYQSHRYIQWVTPTGADRQGFYKLIEHLCTQANARRTLRLDGDLNAVLHKAVKQFTDPTGEIGYAVVRTGGEVPWTHGSLTWLGPQQACYDVLGGNAPTLLGTEEIALNFRPGVGRMFAFVKEPIRDIVVQPAPGQFNAGDLLTVRVRIIGTSGAPVPGSFPLELRVEGPGGAIPALNRSFSAQSGESISINTALNDPVGIWTITVTDGISGVTGTAQVSVTGGNIPAQPGYIAWAQPSEIAEPVAITPDDFVATLRDLAALYQRDLSGEGWLIKQYLGYFYDYFPNTRHAMLQRLNDADWPNFAPAIRQAVMAGDTFILTGEDVNIHPGSGLATYPHHDARQLEAVLAAMSGARWSVITPDGETIAAALGNGRVILSRESIDAAGHTNPSAARWQARWHSQLAAGETRQIETPDLAKLLRWWAGREKLVTGTRTVTWFNENHNERRVTVDPANPLGEVVVITLPPTGDVLAVSMQIVSDAAAELGLDAGCDGLANVKVAATDAAQRIDLTEAVREYLAWAAANHTGPYLDDNGWRHVPIRLKSNAKANVVLSGLIAQVR